MINMNATGEINFKEQISLFWQKKIYFIVPFLIVCTLFLIGSYRLKKIYKSSTTILIGEERAFSSSEQYFYSESGMARLERAVKIKGMILSYEYLKQLIKTLGLDKNEKIRNQALFSYVNMPALSVDEIVERWLLESLRKSIKVELQRSEFLTISVENSDPEKAYLIAKNITQIFIDNSYYTQLKGLEETLDFTNERLSYYKTRVEESEKKLQSFRLGKLQEQREVNSNEQINKLNQFLQSTKININELEKVIQNFDQNLEPIYRNLMTPENSITQKLRNNILDVMSQILTVIIDSDLQDVRLMRLNEKYNAYKTELQKEYEKIIKSNINGISETKNQLIAERKIKELELESMKNRQIALQKMIDIQVGKVESVSEKEAICSLLEQELATNRQMYNMFLQRTRNLQTETAFQKSEGVLTYKIIEPAYIPLYPEKPNKPLLMIVGGFLGLMAGFGLILVISFLDTSFHKIEEVEAFLGLPLLGTITKLPIADERPIWKRYITFKNIVIGICCLIFFGLIIFSDIFWSIFLAFLNKIG
jgi:succinoglycan biosynthesis transport protein ExoP